MVFMSNRYVSFLLSLKWNGNGSIVAMHRTGSPEHLRCVTAFIQSHRYRVRIDKFRSHRTQYEIVAILDQRQFARIENQTNVRILKIEFLVMARRCPRYFAVDVPRQIAQNQRFVCSGDQIVVFACEETKRFMVRRTTNTLWSTSTYP